MTHILLVLGGLILGSAIGVVFAAACVASGRDVYPKACATCPENPANYGDKVAA